MKISQIIFWITSFLYQQLCCNSSVVQKHKATQNTELLRLEGTSGDHLLQLVAQSRVNYIRLLMTMSSRALRISKDGHSTHCLCNPFWYLTPLKKPNKQTNKLMFKQNSLYFSWCPLRFHSKARRVMPSSTSCPNQGLPPFCSHSRR